MKRPDGFFGSNFFEKWIPNWQTYLGHLSGKEGVVGIEIGALYGDCSIFCAEKIANGPNSEHIIIDINNNEYLSNNIAPFKNITFVQGKSYDVLRTHFTNISFADYIYIDGSHLAIDVLSDAVLSWSLLKDDGILIFDDYGWGVHTTDEKQKPKLAIDAFLSAYQGHYQLILKGWQVFVKKLPYVYTKEELEANYQ
jgi:cephalosporin hydroxylase